MTHERSAKVPLSQLPPEEKTARAASFGSVASHYERYRPGPPTAAVDWLLPARARTVVDLGAGTGAMTRLLVGRAEEVVAIEPDDRMRSVLAEAAVGARVLKGRGESLPLPDGCADAVLASSSWHWMDPVPTLNEVARVLRPGGMLGDAVTPWKRLRVAKREGLRREPHTRSPGRRAGGDQPPCGGYSASITAKGMTGRAFADVLAPTRPPVSERRLG